MTFKTDGGGFAFKCNDAKISTGTYGMKLSQLYKQTGTVRIITYSLPDVEYVKAQFERRPHDIFLIAHAKFHSRAQQIKRLFPDIRIAVSNEVHSKLLLIEPHTVYISSANFGNSTWHEMAIGLHSKEAHDFCAKEFLKLWNDCSEVTPYMSREQAEQVVALILAKYPDGRAYAYHCGGGEYIADMHEPNNMSFYSLASWEKYSKVSL